MVKKVLIISTSLRGGSNSDILANECAKGAKDVGRILRTFKIKKNVEVTDNGKIII
ncbi:hypothetical protein [Mediterraneibacter faecis]|uniref:hypothetical protein n=1 Tax=Mediterraneibacter faecis TaxID=592978 RepID=UPI003CE7C76C